MLHRRHMPINLVAVWGLLDLLVLGVGITSIGWGVDLYVLMTLFLWGQLIVLTGWLTVGDEGIRTTQAGLCIGLAAVCVVLGHEEVSLIGAIAPLLQRIILGGIYVLLLNTPLLVATSSGWMLTLDDDARRGEESLWQFHVRDLLIYMAMVGFIGGSWSLTRSWTPNRMTDVPDAALLSVGTTLLLTFPVPWSIWAAFAWTRPLHGGVMAILICCFWGVIFERLLGTATPTILLGLIPPVVMIIHLLALQVAGFRWRRLTSNASRRQ